MIELFYIFFQLLLFLLLSYFPFNKYTTSFSINFDNKDFFLFNILNLLFILLLLSFTKIDIKFFFLSILLINLILFFINLKNIINEILKKKNYMIKISFLLICLFLFINLAQNLQLGYDGLQIWKIKANNFYNGFNYFESANHYDHVKQYPHLGSYLWAFFWKNSLGDKEYFGRLFHIYIYIISLFVICTSIVKISDLKKILIIILLFFFSYDKELNGYQEYLIFALLVFATYFFLKIRKDYSFSKNETFYYFYMLTVSLILICYIKNEGIFYSIFFSIIFAFSKIRKSQKIILISLIIFAISYQFYLTKFVYNLDNSFQFSLTDSFLKNKNIFDISEILSRIISIFAYTVHSALKYPIILIGILSVFISALFFYKIPENKLLLFFFLLNTFFIFSIYIVTPFPFEWHLQTSIKRLYLQTSGIYLFLLVSIINKKIFKI